MNSILAKCSLHENLWILETKRVQIINNHHRNIKWTDSYVYITCSITLHSIFNEQVVHCYFQGVISYILFIYHNAKFGRV